jgi:PST family polysaccharide transporter
MDQRSSEASKDAHLGGYAGAAVSGSAWLTAQTVLNKVVTVFATLVLSRLLTEEEYGSAFSAIHVAVLGIVLPVFVMGDVLQAQATRFNRVAGAANWLAWVSAAAMFLLIAASAPFIAGYMENPALTALVMVAATRPLADAVLAVPHARMRIDLEYRRIALIDGSVFLAMTALGVILAASGIGAVAYVAPPILALALRGILYWRVVRDRIELTLDRAEVRPFLRQYGEAGAGQYLNNIMLSLEVVALGFLARGNAAAVGAFGLAALLASQANAVVASQLGAVLQPIFVHIHHDPQRQVSAFLRATRLLSALAVPFSLMQAALAIPAFSIFLELPKWEGAIGIFAVLSIGQAFVFVAAPAIAMLKAQGRFRAYLVWQGCQVAVAAALFAAGILHGGPSALAIAGIVGLPTSEGIAPALALAFASAIVWALFCPIVVWLAGRPALLGVGTTLSVFFTPWLVAVPATALAIVAWLGLRAAMATLAADVLAVLVVGPIIGLATVVLAARLRADTWTDFRSLVARIPVRAVRRWATSGSAP